MRMRKLHKIDWLVVDIAGQPMIELQERGQSRCLYRSKVQDRVEVAIESGARHLTNYGRGLSPDAAEAIDIRARGNLLGYLSYSHGPDHYAWTDTAQGIISAPEGYVPGSFELP
jgi:hypothetical protein